MAAVIHQFRRVLLNSLPALKARSSNYDVLSVRGMSGHSKWQNIRHTKALMDAQRAALFDRCIRMIKAAAREAGTTDPSKNLKLSHAVQYAKDKQVPKLKIENALKTFEMSKDNLVTYNIEVKGPAGTFFIIETLTDNVRRTSQAVRTVINKAKNRFTVVVDGGIMKQMFHHKGVINAELNENVSLELAVDHAIEAGAEEVMSTEDENGNKVLQFVSDARDFYTVKKNLENLKYAIISSELLYVPQVKQPMSDEDMETTKKLYDYLEELPDIVKIYDNIA